MKEREQRDSSRDINVRNFQRTWPVDTDGVRSLASRTLDELNIGVAAVSVVFVGKRKIRELNRTYRGRDEVTDVLSFPLEDGPSVGEDTELGDVVVCPARAEEQARDRGRRLEVEIGLLVVHGLLHLAGIHHDSGRGRKRMERLQRKILGGPA